MQQGVIPVFMRKVLNGEPLEIWGDGKVVRDYIYVDDVARAFLAAAEYGGPLGEFNIATGEGVSLLDIIARLEELQDRGIAVAFRPARSFDLPEVVLDVCQAGEHLGWTPQVGFSAGLLTTWQSISQC